MRPSIPSVTKLVVFACTGRSARSQMAEALFNSMVKRGARVSSAGTRPAGAVDPAAVEVMKEVGIDISENRPKPLTMDMIMNADFVISMGCSGSECPSRMDADWQIPEFAAKLGWI